MANPVFPPFRMTSWKRSVGALLLFGISFGYVEAAVGVYLRGLYDAAAGRANRPIDPMALLAQLTSGGATNDRLLHAEMFREGATLVMLAAVALAAARNIPQGLAAFVIAFGAWDISYYASLKVLLDWPPSVFAWDLLFLVPVPWVGPVLAPVLVSVSMILAGTVVLWLEHNGHRCRVGWLPWALLVAGGLTVILSFTWDFRSALAGRQPDPFRWTLFLLGEAAGLGAFLLAVRPPRAADARARRERNVGRPQEPVWLNERPDAVN